MKKFLIVLFFGLLATAVGLYFRPSFSLIGQLDWVNVITKGHFAGSMQKFFAQAMIDESFYYVMRFTGGGLLLGVLATLALGGGKASKGKAGKKK